MRKEEMTVTKSMALRRLQKRKSIYVECKVDEC
jgi:hypothetical protein